MTSPELMVSATPRTACTEPKCLCTSRRSTAGGQTASSWRPGRAAGSAPRLAICISRPAGLASDPGFLLNRAPFAAPPPWSERARAHPAPCDVPDRKEHHNDHDNQLNTHPGISWRAELLRRGVGSVWGDKPKRSSCPNKASLPRRDFFQSTMGKVGPERSGSGPGSLALAYAPSWSAGQARRRLVRNRPGGWIRQACGRDWIAGRAGVVAGDVHA